MSSQREFKVCERYLTMSDLRRGLKENRVKEMFGSGTACVVCPVGRVLYQGEVIAIGTANINIRLFLHTEHTYIPTCIHHIALGNKYWSIQYVYAYINQLYLLKRYV